MTPRFLSRAHCFLHTHIHILAHIRATCLSSFILPLSLYRHVYLFLLRAPPSATWARVTKHFLSSPCAAAARPNCVRAKRHYIALPRAPFFLAVLHFIVHSQSRSLFPFFLSFFFKAAAALSNALLALVPLFNEFYIYHII